MNATEAAGASLRDLRYVPGQWHVLPRHLRMTP